MKTTRTIFVTGGIVSGIGKGITAASLGALLKARGFSVIPKKMDAYLNVDAGTMNPFQHGEVFVTDDGTETDLDLGHYERMLDANLSKISYMTMGSVYQKVTEEERKGSYLGKTIQIVPHVTDEIQRRFDLVNGTKPDFQIIELGGTVGDLEAEFSLEAVRQFRMKHGKNAISVHVVKMDYLYPSDEGKTKPIQHSVAVLRRYGINPDILIVRCKRTITKAEREKIALFCGIDKDHVIAAMDATSLYQIPLNMEKESLANEVLGLFDIVAPKSDLSKLRKIAERVRITSPQIRIGLIGKYTDLSDSYLSVIEAAKHAGIANHAKVSVIPIDSENLNIDELEKVDCIIVPGGFGSRGVEGKISAIKWARENRVPFLGICLGLQCAVIEISRHVIGLAEANSTEFDEKTPDPVIAILPEQAAITWKGGTMRLGVYEAEMNPDSRIARLYKWAHTAKLDFPKLANIDQAAPIDKTVERHRHRYEVNPEYHERLREAGLVFAGTSSDGTLVEFIELPASVHPYFVATQAHPEFRSRPSHAHPLFAGLVRAAIEKMHPTHEVVEPSMEHLLDVPAVS